MRKRFYISASGILAAIVMAAVITGLAGSRRLDSSRRCRGIDVCVQDSSNNHFADNKTITRIIDRNFGGYRNRLCDSVNLHKLECMLKNQDYISSADAFFTSDGMLHVVVDQYDPRFRFSCSGEDYYVCDNLSYIKTSQDWCQDLVSIDGTKEQIGDGRWTALAIAGMKWIKGNSPLAGLVNRMYCNERGELSMRLEGKPETFVLGYPDNIREKFRRLDSYLEKIAPTLEEKKLKYSLVNVEFNGQIVCKQ